MAKENLLLLHGALGAAAQFNSLKQNLEKYFQVFTLDFEGHGQSGNSERPFSIDHFAENLSAFLKQHSEKQFWIFGYSMGGFVALRFASQNATQIKGIITLGTKFHWDESTAEHETKFLDPEKIKTKVPAFAAQLQQLHLVGFENVLNKTAAMMMALGKHNPLTEAELSQINIPIKVMLGEMDNMVSSEETMNAFHALPHAQFQLLINTPHPIDKMREELLVLSIRNFIERS